MRSAAVDTRLEAIAGPPAVRASGPMRTAGFPPDSTICAVGLWVLDESATHQRLFSASGVAVGVLDDGGWYRSGPQQVGRTGAAFHAYGTTPAAGIIGLGMSQSGAAGYDWAGPFAAVVYDWTLTNWQAMAVIRHLAATLT